MITVHHLEYSRSQRVLWLLEELGVPYEVKTYKRNPKTKLAAPEMKAIHPLGKSPIITDEGQVVAESGAILEYLLDRYDPSHTLRPAPGTPERLQYNYWLHYAEGSLMPPLLVALIFGEVQKAKLPFFVKPIVNGIVSKVKAAYIGPQIKLHYGFMEQELQKKPWFAGQNFTAADIQMSYPLEAGLTRGPSGSQYPHIQNLVNRMKERPAWKKAEAKVGDFGTPM
jgi:glutathione S-transferase